MSLSSVAEGKRPKCESSAKTRWDGQLDGDTYTVGTFHPPSAKIEMKIIGDIHLETFIQAFWAKAGGV
jgi:hypothetical protein